MKRILVIGRHSLTNRQKKLLEKAFGKFQIVASVATVNPNNPMSTLANYPSYDAILVQTLPLSILALLVRDSKKPIYMFEIEAVDVVTSQNVAEQVAKDNDADIITPDPRTGNFRVAKTTKLMYVSAIRIETQTIATLEENSKSDSEAQA